jgi:Ca2+-binding EF-hand superfamily protein
MRNLKDDLIELFENIDEEHKGYIDKAVFKTCLRKSTLDIDVKDVNRIVRYLPKVKNDSIDYYEFIKLLETVDNNNDIEIV